MIEGSYKHKIEWRDYESPKALDVFKANALTCKASYNTCGSAALALLTGINAFKVEKQLPGQRLHWTDSSATRFLRARGYTVTPVSKYGVTNLSNRPCDGEWHKMPLNPNHVLLCNMLMCRDEASWFVVHQNYSVHNFSFESLSPLLFVNKPSQSIHLVTHPKWQ